MSTMARHTMHAALALAAPARPPTAPRYGYLCDPLTLWARCEEGGRGVRLPEVLDEITPEDALERLGRSAASWRDGQPRRETRWVQVELVEIERGLSSALAAATQDPPGRVALLSVPPKKPPCVAGRHRAVRLDTDSGLDLDVLHYCSRCGWSIERIDEVRSLSPGRTRSVDPGAAVSALRGPWVRYLHHGPRRTADEVRARVAAELRLLVRLPARTAAGTRAREALLAARGTVFTGPRIAEIETRVA